MTDDLSWNSALRVAGINLTNEERGAGWPPAFTPENLARLQYPWGGSALEKKAANENQSLLIATISKAIQNGGLPAVERTRTEDITESRQVPDFHAPSSPYSGGLGSSYWLNRDQAPTMRTVTKKIGERAVSYFVIERSAFRDWLTNQSLEPSVHIQAWLRALDSSAGSGEEQNEAPSLTPVTRRTIIKELSRRYPSLESDFNRPADWVKECSTGKRGEYYREKIEAGCRSKWGNGNAPAALVAAVQTHKIRG